MPNASVHKHQHQLPWQRRRSSVGLVSGFTLIEFMIAITIVAILSSVAIPAYNSVVTSTRLSGEIQAVLGGLNLARSNASMTGQSVSVCPTSGGSTCVSASSSWTGGWQVLNTGSSTQLMINPGVTHGDNLVSTVASYPVFTPMGYTFFSGTISLHDSNNISRLRQCIVFNAGSWTAQSGAACP